MARTPFSQHLNVDGTPYTIPPGKYFVGAVMSFMTSNIDCRLFVDDREVAAAGRGYLESNMVAKPFILKAGQAVSRTPRSGSGAGWGNEEVYLSGFLYDL